MKALKNILVGFLVSFVGSIPLGYLNIIGYQIHGKSGMQSLVFYLFGVILIESLVIYFTLVFANTLANNKKLIRYIELFSIFFMLLLAYLFWAQSGPNPQESNDLAAYTNYPPLLVGIIFSALNFMQVPFWTGWNLYLLNNRYISAEKNLRFVYVAGTLAGTFCGILAIVLFLNLVAEKSKTASGYLMSHVIPLFFLGMAIFQMYKFYKKHNRHSRPKKP